MAPVCPLSTKSRRAVLDGDSREKLWGGWGGAKVRWALMASSVVGKETGRPHQASGRDRYLIVSRWVFSENSGQVSRYHTSTGLRTRRWIHSPREGSSSVWLY